MNLLPMSNKIVPVMLKLVIWDGARYIGCITGKKRKDRGSVSV